MRRDSTKTLVYGIPCFLRDPILREGAQRTLQRIRDRSPKDFRRLQSLVKAIRPYDDADDGTLGEWFPEFPTEDDPATWDYGVGDTPGVLKLVETIQKECLPGLLAHELGHAATRHEDRERRGALSSDEWRSEMAADWYAYKWGFGRDIARDRKNRAWMHHGAPPGSTFKESSDGKIYHYKITRNFVGHLTKITEGCLQVTLPLSS
jgi:hypothetical protein